MTPRENKTAADKGQLIQAIRALNPTATEEFLSRFDARELGDYLRNLQLTVGQQGSAESAQPRLRRAS